MTDHLETYRQMVRSMRFSPPLSLNQSQSAVHRVTTAPDDSLPKLPLADTPWQTASEPSIDPSEHTAALVHEAVRKPTVLPVSYAILENIGDRINRLNPAKPVAFINPFKIPPADPQGMVAQTVSEAKPVQVNHQGWRDNAPVTVATSPIAVEDTTVREQASAAVAEPIAVEQTADEEIAVASESIVEEEAFDNEEIVVVTPPVEVEAAPASNLSETDAPATESEATQSPTLLDKVSSLVEAVSNALHPDPNHKDSDAVEEPVPSDTTHTEAATDLAESPTVKETEDTSTPTLLEKVSSAIESVVSTLKDTGSETEQKNTDAVVELAPVETENPASGQINLASSPEEKENNSELEHNTSEATSQAKDSQVDPELSNGTSKSSKRSGQKKKTKAKGFGGRRAK